MSAPLDARQRLDWVRLSRSEGVGPRTFHALVGRFGGAGAALEALPALARAKARTVHIPSAAEISAEIGRAERLGARLVASCEPCYPRRLAELEAPPPVIAVLGSVALLDRPLVGIVGARNASAVGRKLAVSLAGGLVAAGFGTVSGLARGIDTEVHRASLAGGTVAVLAGGLDRPYPPENAGLLEEIIEKGAAISEMPFGLSPRGRDFPRRNRLISGLSMGIVVVEAARRSGSLITARFAGEQGREVFAVPGSPLDPRAEGTNDLIRDGASLVTSAADVLAILRPLAGEEERAPLLFREPPADSAEPIDDEWAEADEIVLAAARTGGFDAEDEGEAGDAKLPADLRLLQLVSAAPVDLDDLGRLAGLDPRTLQALVTELELAGEVERLGGNRLVRVVRG